MPDSPFVPLARPARPFNPHTVLPNTQNAKVDRPVLDVRIAICTPTREMLHATFCHDVTCAAVYTAMRVREIQPFSLIGTVIHESRQNIAQIALKEGADYLMWFDTDMRFRPSIIMNLLGRNKAIVGCNYALKEIPPRPVARAYRDGFWYPKRTKPTDTGIEQISGIGFGAILVAAKVFKAMEPPWFATPFSTVNNRFMGEDLFFCSKAQEAGYVTWLDHDETRFCRHVGNFEYSMEHIDAYADDEGQADIEGVPV